MRKKAPKLKWSEMNKKQKVIFVLDWIMRGILIALIFIMVVTFGISCVKSCGKKNSSTVAYAEEDNGISLLSIDSINFNNNILTCPIYNFKGRGGGDAGTAWVICSQFPQIQFTIEVVENIPSSINYQIHIVYIDGSSMAVDFVDRKYVTYSLVDLPNYNFIEIRMFGDQTFELDNNFYFYSGPYVPGYGQGLAAGIQQGKAEGYSEGYSEGYNVGKDEGNTEGYNKGYNQGVEDTAKEYALGLFNNSVARFANVSQPADLSINSFTDQLNMEYDGDIYYSGYPDLSVPNKFFYLLIEFDNPFVLNETTFYFNFASKLPIVGSPSYVNFSDVGVYFLMDGASSPLPSVGTPSVVLVPMEGTNYTYKLQLFNNSSISPFGFPISKMLIGFYNYSADSYDIFKSLHLTTEQSSNSSYYAGYSYGYNNGYSAGESAGQQMGNDKFYNDGYSDGFQKGFNQSESGGFGWLISSVQAFLNTNFFGDFGIGTLLYVSLGVLLVMYFLKLLAGG